MKNDTISENFEDRLERFQMLFYNLHTCLDLGLLLIGDDTVVAVVGEDISEGSTLLFGPTGIDEIEVFRLKGIVVATCR